MANRSPRGRALVYNEHLDQLGGGERSTLAFNRALAELGYDSDIVSTRPAPTTGTLVAQFGKEFAGSRIRRLTPPDLATHLRSADVRVFVNHTYMSFLANRSAVGIYAQMFPWRRLDPVRNGLQLEALASYTMMICNSDFTLEHTRARWGRVPEAQTVLHPPIGDGMAAAGRRFARHPVRKDKLFVHVGRFSPHLHTKNQHLIITAFTAAVRRYAHLRDWRLLLIGARGRDAASQQYYDRCVTLAANSDGRVVVRADVPVRELSTVLTRSFASVHATGAFLGHDERPEECEHFGLAMVEAMAHGCLLLAFARGGIWEIAGGARGMCRYATPRELDEGFCHVASLYDAPGTLELQQDNVQRALRLEFQHFKARLGALIADADSRRA